MRQVRRCSLYQGGMLGGLWSVPYKRHHFRAPCPQGPDPQRSLVEENRALHDRNRALEQELAQVRGQLNTQLQITNLYQQQTQGSIYSSPFLPSQPAMQPPALQASGMQPQAWEQPRASGSFSGFGRSKQTANTRSGPPKGAGSFRGGKGSEGGGEDAAKGSEKKVAEQPKKRAEASKEKMADMRKKQAEAKKQPVEKDAQSSTWADECNLAASTEGKMPSRGQRRRENLRNRKAENEQKQKEVEGEKKEGASGNTEAMDLDEEAQAPTSTDPNDGGEESSRASVSTLAFRERSSEVEAGAGEPTGASQPQPQPYQQASEPAKNSVPGVDDGSGAAPGPSEPR